VVDTSVAVKWFFEEPDSSAALEILRDARSGDRLLLVPDLIFAELGNAIRKRVVRDGLAPEDGALIVAAFSRLPFGAVLRTPPLLPAAYRLALEHGCTVYDAVFLAVSSTAGVGLITADERLYRAVAGKLPGIERLGGRGR
jgi:predicted nucleic acid-binding protein